MGREIKASNKRPVMVRVIRGLYWGRVIKACNKRHVMGACNRGV